MDEPDTPSCHLSAPPPPGKIVETKVETCHIGLYISKKYNGEKTCLEILAYQHDQEQTYRI